MAYLAAAREGIVVARQQYVAELELMNAFRARGLAMTQIGAVTTELATLGRQQAAVTARQTAATAALSVAQSSLAKANAAAGATSGLVTSALGLLGGPIGAITTALGLGVTAWMLWGNASSDNEAKAQESVERSTEETGRPEMFTASNGSQYLMPTANGSVTAADKVGGGPLKRSRLSLVPSCWTTPPPAAAPVPPQH